MSKLSKMEIEILTDIVNGLSEEELVIIEQAILERRVKGKKS